jgi:uncharacterized membrane protein (DUF485 family)
MDETPAARNETVRPKRSLRFKIGVFFLVVNMPFGFGGGFLAAAIGVKKGQPKFGLVLGVGIYILSWIMLGLGIWMAGPEGVQLAKDLCKKWFGVKKESSRPVAPRCR